MTIAFQVGGPAAQNEWFVFFIFVSIFTAILSGEWLDHKAKALIRKQERLDTTSESLNRTMLEGRCTICQERIDTLIKPFDWNPGDAA